LDEAMATSPAPAKNRGWLWYFILLGFLSILATTILVVYNLQQQLKPEQLEAAQKLWQEKGLKSYHLVYTIKIHELSTTDYYDVRVKDGFVTQVSVNNLAQPASKFHYYGMEKLFSYIDTNLERDQKKGQPRTFTRAIFDPGHGGLRWYVRRVMGSKERVELTVEKLEPLLTIEGNKLGEPGA
jgi:hypothetical protein